IHAGDGVSGGVRLTVVADRVRRDHHGGVGLADGVGDGGGGDVVLVSRAGETPTVRVVSAGVGVRGVAHVHCTDGDSGFTVHAGDGVSGGVRKAVIGDRVRRDHHG